MDNSTLQIIVDEITPILEKRSFGKVFQLARHQLVIDFRPGDGRYLYLNFEPALTPRLYLVRRRVRDLEKQSEQSSNFVLFVRKRLASAQLYKIIKDGNDRIVRFAFLAETETSEVEKFTLVAQLTGRTANLFLLDAKNVILDSLRESQPIGEVYAPPLTENVLESKKPALSEIVKNVQLPNNDYEFSPPSPWSEKLDSYFGKLETEREFQIHAQAASSRIRQELIKKEKLLQRLELDLTRHGDAEQLKKFGDLLLANHATARRVGDKVYLTDYFDEKAPEISIEVDENLSLPEAAEKFFARYAKARNAATELTERIRNLKTEVAELKAKQKTLEEIVVEQNQAKLDAFAENNNLVAKRKSFDEQQPKPVKKKELEAPSGTRRYRSSDGLEILVGRSSKDNDYLTMRMAKSLDWWLHAADYPGSHVVVRNPSKGELPNKTLLEAAQLAAKFSQAKADAKVAVNYTQRKFVSKPKNAQPGMVRLASFRTIMVEPKEAGERVL